MILYLTIDDSSSFILSLPIIFIQHGVMLSRLDLICCKTLSPQYNIHTLLPNCIKRVVTILNQSSSHLVPLNPFFNIIPLVSKISKSQGSTHTLYLSSLSLSHYLPTINLSPLLPPRRPLPLNPISLLNTNISIIKLCTIKCPCGDFFIG